MTRREIVEKMDEVFDTHHQAGMIVFRSPMTDVLEERHIYADEYMEVEMWIEWMKEKYIKMGVMFILYINNTIYYHTPDFEINKEDCSDE